MKKKLVASLAAAMVLGVAGTSFAAANPFTDVPAKHWAYASVTKLAQAGIVDGYGDGTYLGDKMISRYEMAQMVAKAMARSDKADAMQKVEIDKLAVEFAEELNTLGVRVSNLEKKVGTIAMSGDLRVRYTATENQADGVFKERFRINMKADVNEDTSFYGRYMVMKHTAAGTTANDDNQIADAQLTTKNFLGSSAALTMGRYSENALSTGYFLGTTGMVDGVKASFGNKLKATIGYADMGNLDTAGKAAVASYVGVVGGAPGVIAATAAVAPAVKDVAYLTASYNTSKATTLSALYMDFKGSSTFEDAMGFGLSTKLTNTIGLKADYTTMNRTGALDDANAYVVQLNYKGANKAQPKSFGLGLEYKNFEDGAVFNVSDYNSYAMTGLADVKNYVVSANYTLQKNIVLSAWQTFNSKSASTGADKNEFSRIQVDYTF